MIKRISLQKLNIGLAFIVTVPFFAFAIFWFRFTPQNQFFIFTLATILYLIFALIHHFREKTLILEIVIEYVLIAILALVIVQSFLI